MNKIFKMQLRDKACTICSGVHSKKYKSKRRCETCQGRRNWRLDKGFEWMLNKKWKGGGEE